MDKAGDGCGIAVVEAHGDGKDFVGGRGREGNAEFGAVWVCGDEGCGEEGREDEGGCGERLPGGGNEAKGRHPDCSRIGLELRLLNLFLEKAR